MKQQQKHLQDLTEIRSMMEQSSKFLTLTGWSGIMAGSYALLAAFFTYLLFSADGVNRYTVQDSVELNGKLFNLLLIAGVALLSAIGTAVFLSYKKSRKTKTPLWNSAARRLVVNMSIPLFSGGIFILLLFSRELFSLILPLTLIFYGLALLTASKDTYQEIKYLGLIQIGFGLIATYFITYALLFWAAGFGVMHIIYGIYLHKKYDK